MYQLYIVHYITQVCEANKQIFMSEILLTYGHCSVKVGKYNTKSDSTVSTDKGCYD